jgi:hypothetical protein
MSMLTTSSVMIVFRNRLAFASRPGRPWSDSTSTIVDTIGGKSPAARSSCISANAARDLSDSRPKPPLSRTSMSGSLMQMVLLETLHDSSGPSPISH